MKRKYIVTLLLIAAATASFFSCKNGLTMFEQIDQETKLEDALITGAVNSVVKFNGKLYACDGNIYSKNESAVRDWSKISSPGGTIIKLAADATNLYAQNSSDEISYSTDGANWTRIDLSSTLSSVETIFSNGLDTAYLHGTAKGASEKTYFTLTASGATAASEITSTVLLKTDKGTYTAKGGTVTGSTDLGSVPDLGTVYSLTYSATDKAIYAGTNKGLKKLPVDDSGKLTGKAENPPGNWGATIKDYQAFSVLATGSNSSDSALYTSTIATGSANVKVNGLWGYYYNRRDNWNRE